MKTLLVTAALVSIGGATAAQEASQEHCNALVASMSAMVEATMVNTEMRGHLMRDQLEILRQVDPETDLTLMAATQSLTVSIESLAGIDPTLLSSGLSALQAVCPANFE